MNYDILIRFEPQMPDTWQEVRVTVTRDRPVDQNGNCANEMQIQDLKVAYLPRGELDDLGASFQRHSGFLIHKNFFLLGERHFMVQPSSCLEEGVGVTIRVEFIAYNSDRSTPGASVLIDSVRRF